MMAEPAKAVPKHKETVVSDAQRKHERLTLFLFLEGAVAIVAGMVLISEFLSQGSADRTVLYIAGALLGVLALGILGTWLLRRSGDKARA